MRRSESETDRATILSPLDAAGDNSAPRLVVVGGALLGLQVPIGTDPIVIGRSSECELCLPHPSVSRQHCRVLRRGDEYVIEDLGSTNRTLLNGSAVECSALADGDHIAVGNHALKFFRGTSPEARYHQELIDLAIYDSLTGFLNRRQFRTKLSEELASCLADRVPISLLIIDIDHFKRINDQHGHLTGDFVLSELARVMRGAMTTPLLGRIGGEEFALGLPGCALEQAAIEAERLRAAVEQHRFEGKNEVLPITISVGIAEHCGTFASDLAPWFQLADKALYAAKHGGRNQVRSLSM